MRVGSVVKPEQPPEATIEEFFSSTARTPKFGAPNKTGFFSVISPSSNIPRGRRVASVCVCVYKFQQCNSVRNRIQLRPPDQDPSISLMAYAAIGLFGAHEICAL